MLLFLVTLKVENWTFRTLTKQFYGSNRTLLTALDLELDQ